MVSLIARYLSLLLWVVALHAADPCDPFASCDSRHAFSCLAALRGPLDAAPDDQHLLGLAIMAYVNLVLPTPHADPGDAGPFFGYARILRDRRVAARRGAPHASLNEAVPELWLAACEGHMRQVVDQLAQWPDAAKNPIAQAVRCFATRDRRIMVEQEAATALGRYALLWATAEDEQTHTLQGQISSRVGLPLRQREDLCHQRYSRQEALATTLIGESAWMLRSNSLTDAEACDMLKGILQASGESVLEASDRNRLIAAAQHLEHARCLWPTWKVCDHLADRTSGLMDGQHHRLMGLGDVARWNRDWLTRIIPQIVWEHDEGLFPQATHDSLAKDPATGLLIRWMDLKPFDEGWEEFAVDRQPAPISLAEATTAFHTIEAAWEREGAIPDPLLMAITAAVAARGTGADPMPTLDLLSRRRVLAAREPGLIERRRWCRALIHASRGPDEAFRANLAHWCEDDPWDRQLDAFRRLWSPDHRHLGIMAAPDRTWITPVLTGHFALPAGMAGTEIESEYFLVRWTGYVHIPVNGVCRFAIEADDGFRLVVGDAVLDNWCFRRTYRCPVSWNFNAGWIPLTLEFFQGPGPYFCRLFWQPPGAGAWTPLPAAALTHGDDRQPGLSTELWTSYHKRCGIVRSEADLAWARERPWLATAGYDTGQALARAGRWQDAIPWLEADLAREEAAVNLAESSRSLLTAYIMKDPPDHAKAMALLNVDNLGFADSRDAPWLACERLCRIGAGAIALATVEEGLKRVGHLEDYHADMVMLRARTALHEGLFTRAYADLSWILEKEDRQESLTRSAIRRQCHLEHLLLARITGVAEPPQDVLLDAMEKNGLEHSPWDQAAVAYLMGWTDWATAWNQTATSARPAWLRYYHGLQAIAEHHYDEAKADFQALVTAGPDWSATTMAQGLAGWIDRLTPEQSARLPTAKAIVLRPDPRLPAGAGNF